MKQIDSTIAASLSLSLPLSLSLSLSLPLILDKFWQINEFLQCLTY
jgi:hypothetical protein